MFPFLASALPRPRNSDAERIELPEPQLPARLALVPPAALSTPIMASEPSPLSKALDAMLLILKGYLPPLLNPPPPPQLPPNSVLVTSVVERTVGLGSRVGTELRGPFSVAAKKGLRAEAVVRYEIWVNTPAEIGVAIEDLIKRLLGDRELLRAQGFLRIALKSAGPSENVFAEDAWRQSVEFEVLFEFPFIDSDGAESLIARIPIDMVGEFNESTTVVDEMARWDNQSAPTLLMRGRLSIGNLTALAFIPGTAPAGKVTLARTFDGAAGLPTTHPNLKSFLAAVAGANPPERHAEVVFTSLEEFLAALTSFKVTGRSLDGLAAEAVPPTPAVLANLEGIKDQEIGGTDEFLTKLEATIGVIETAAFKSVILKHTTTSEPVTMGDWDKNSVQDIYESPIRRIDPAIKLPTVADRLEVTYDLTPSTTDFAVVYLRATRD